ncbi:MAG: succinate dehydrogenase cytochrome b subunit [Myxococcota bacterium]
MNWALKYWNSSVGKKALMAITGIIGLGFTFVHMSGNLLVYAGRDALNAYAAALKATPPLLWGTRVVLLLAVLLHAICAIQLYSRRADARPVKYQRPGNIQSSLASRTMHFSAAFLVFFILYHLAHFTWGNAHPNFNKTDVYANVVSGFQVWYVSAFYILCMVALGMHLWHGSWSFLSSLGINHQKYNLAFRRLGKLIALAIVVGNISIPVSVLTGLIKA